MNKSLYYKISSEVIFTLGYLTAVLASNNANTFIIKLFVLLFTLSLASYIVHKNAKGRIHRILICTILAFCGLTLILISKYYAIGTGISIAIIIIGSILCAPLILLIENII